MKILKSLILAALLISTCFSQSSDTVGYSLEKGSWSLQFQVGNDFQLTSFDGVIVSLKYHFTPKFAFRFGAGMNLSSNDIQITDFEYSTGEFFDEPVSKSVRDFLLTTYFLLYPKPNALFKIFFGIGPRGTYAFSHDEGFNTNIIKIIREDEIWSAGLNGIFGVEWFPTGYLSLFGEYSVYGTYGKSTVNQYETNVDTGEKYSYYYKSSDNLIFRGNIARLGLGVYF